MGSDLYTTRVKLFRKQRFVFFLSVFVCLSVRVGIMHFGLAVGPGIGCKWDTVIDATTKCLVPNIKWFDFALDVACTPGSEPTTDTLYRS